MRTSENLANLLAAISLKGMLKEALFLRLEAVGIRLPLNHEIPIKKIDCELEVLYSSAITLALAAKSSEKPGLLADRLAQERTMSSFTEASFANPRAKIAHSVSIRHASDGWLILFLCDQGIAWWLWSVNTLSANILSAVSPSGSQIHCQTAMIESATATPLCQQLKLSVPMLLHWAYARCNARLCQATAISKPFFDSHSQSGTANFTWSSESPIVCHELLHSIISAIDNLVAKSDSSKTSIYHGYLLAEAIYRFDAAVSVSACKAMSTQCQQSVWSLLITAQNLLALMITVMLKQTPLSSL